MIAKVSPKTKIQSITGVTVEVKHVIELFGSVMIGPPDEIGLKKSQPTKDEDYAPRNSGTEEP